MTAGDLIKRSLSLIGVLSNGESPASQESNDALAILNDLIDSWSTERLLIPASIRETFSLISGQQAYTMGTGGNFNTPRPEKIENAIIQLASNTPVLELPLKILSRDEFARIVLKTLANAYPVYLYNDGAYPLTNINIWPIPNTGVNNLVLYSWKTLSEFASLTTSVSLPPGYQRALRYALALELAPEYGKALPETIIALAGESKSAIKRANYKPDYLQVDSELLGKPSVWNWLTGGYQ